MKKLILISLLFIGFVSNIQAQTVNETPISEVDVEYVQIVGTGKFFSSKVSIQLDFGQETTLFTKSKDTQLYDVDGKKKNFESMVDALNFMAQHGYELDQAYALSVGNQNVYHFLLKKVEYEIQRR